MRALVRRLSVVMVASVAFLGLATVPVEQAQAAVTIPKPISLYRFDETTGATTIADSIRGAKGTGTLVGAPTFETGKVGNAMCLNGTSQYATAPLVGNGLQEFTISAWVKLDTYTQWATVAKNWGAFKKGAFHLGLDDNNKFWSNYIGTTGDDGLVTSASAGQAVLSSWQYLVTTVSQTTGQATLYLNGTKVSKPDPFSGTIVDYKTLMSFGVKLNDNQDGPASPNPGWLDGCLDEIAFWDVALTEAQLDEIYNGGGGVPKPEIVTFDPNGGTGMMAAQSASSQTALSSNSFTRVGYTFVGWSTAASGVVEYADGASFPFTSSATLYAQWKATDASDSGETLAKTGLSGISLIASGAILALIAGTVLVVPRRRRMR